MDYKQRSDNIVRSNQYNTRWHHRNDNTNDNIRASGSPKAKIIHQKGTDFSKKYPIVLLKNNFQDNTETTDIPKVSNVCQKGTDISKVSPIMVLKKDFQDSAGTTDIPKVNIITSYIPKGKNINQKKTDISSMCRVCLTKSLTTMYELTNTIEGITDSGNKGIPIIQALQTVTSSTIILRPKYPQYICPMCLSMLKMAYKFILNFKESQIQLEETENNWENKKKLSLIDGDSMLIEESGGCEMKFNGSSKLGEEITDTSAGQKHEKPKLETLGRKRKMEGDIDNEMIVGIEEETDDNWRKGRVELIIDEEEFDLNNMDVEEDKECEGKFDGLLTELGITETSTGGKFEALNLDDDDTITILTKDENNVISLRKIQKDEGMDEIRVEVESDEFKAFSDLEHTNNDEIEHWGNEPASVPGEFQTDYDDAEDAIVATESTHDHTYSETNISDLNYNEEDEFPSKRDSDNTSHTDKPLSKMFSCQRCGRSCNTKEQLKEHMSTHLVEKKFVCTLCGVRFYQQNGLARHMQLHTYGKRYQCPYCAELFSLESSLQSHERIHIAEKFPCQFCDQMFISNRARSAHESIHTGFKPYVCRYCKEGFKEANDLKLHLFQHPGPHNCNICDKDFIDRPILHLHYKESHGSLLPDIDISSWKLLDYCEEAAELEEMSSR